MVTQRPAAPPLGQLVIVHGLEGSSDSGYMRSLAQRALDAGFIAHRFNLRSCGGTESLALSNYHSGQTSDLLFVLQTLRSSLPLFLAGFSLGGNVSLKLAGQLSDASLLSGVIAVSTPIDLAACVVQLARRENWIYEQRFVTRLKARIELRVQQAPELYSPEYLPRVKSVYEFDDCYTAKLFGFGTADNYYATQSAKNFLPSIRIPALLIQAKDDPLIPFSVYRQPAFETNPNLQLIATDHGGHVGFIARGPDRFWVDGQILAWIKSQVARISRSEADPRVGLNVS